MKIFMMKTMKMKNPIRMKMIISREIIEIKIIIWKKKLTTIMKEKAKSRNRTMANISRTSKAMRRKKRKKKSQMNSSTIQKKKLTVREFE